MLESTLVLAVLAALMAIVTAILVKWAAAARTRSQAAVVLFLLGMMAAMFLGAAIYFLAPSSHSLVEGLWVSSAAMSVSVFPVFLVFLEEARERTAAGEGYSPRPMSSRPTFVAAAILLVLLNELLMGWTFQLANGAALTGAGATLAGAGAGLADVLVSPWFVFTMGAEMILAVLLLGPALTLPLRGMLGFQAAIMVLTPPALTLGWWSAGSVYVGSALMIGLVVYQMEFLYRSRQLNGALAAYILRLLAIYAVMMAGLFAWVAYGSLPLLAASVVLEMVLYLEAVLGGERFTSGPVTSWQLRPHWVFALLGTIFIAELFMGALLDVQAFGTSWLALVPALPLAGGPAAVTYAAVNNGFWFLALVTGSTWFLAMMGVEMGSLVVFKLRETRHRELRVRLGLMIGCYALAAVYFPSIYYSLAFPQLPAGTAVPVLGWSMGIGSAPLAPSVFVVLLVSYALVGSLSVLFGRRVICSTFCTAALMYQGTTIDAMKSFNRSAPVGRKFLGSRFSTAYSVTTGVVMGSLALASFASYFDTRGLLQISILGADPTVFLFALYFGVLWYVMFVTMPYTGTYNCVTMGWCYTGTIAQAFQKVGFFKLKVRDKAVCKACTTLDCAKSCPVGLVDMVGHFRTTGEFRSSKCCGVGNCVGACPYGNLYIHDIRHWVRDRLTHPQPRPLGTPLPMFRATTAGVGSRTSSTSATGRESVGAAPLTP
ncbi:MAG: hypothetical protein L3K17_05825 [Thermoplasmata archaeon]|nr:hypothetical protein [Thermoplasmata archaeon]